MREPKFLVTGSGRSGTGFLAKTLQSCGLEVGHENWWTVNPKRVRDFLDGDVSWLGCFDDGFRGKVYAQVRDPRTCIPSIYQGENRLPWVLVRRQNVRCTGDWATDAARIWLEYTRHAVDRAESWWRLEDVAAADLAVFGVDASKALEQVPPDVNARPTGDYPWPSDPVIDACLELGRELGYGEDRRSGHHAQQT